MLNQINSTLFKKRIILFIYLIFVIGNLSAQSNDDCFMCHDDPSLTTVKNGVKKSLYMNSNSLRGTVHRNVLCASCHKDAAVEEFPHSENLKKVNCGGCHTNANKAYMAGLHGQAYKNGELYAPSCIECHGEIHNILPPSNPKSKTYKMNIPYLCGKCHREGAPVARVYNIAEHNIMENYSQSIHGHGLFKSGLIVSATCNDCHGNHMVLPGTTANSTVSPKNIAKTCMKCHVNIEEVHVKIINKEFWQESPDVIPSCNDCHPPHKVNVENINIHVLDQTCLECHEKGDAHKIVNGEKVSLIINKDDIAGSVHKTISCVKCHSDVSINLDRPCETTQGVDCSNCHEEAANLYMASGHGQAHFNKHENAPYCTDCHGRHGIKSERDDTSPTFRSAVPELCGKCHKSEGNANMDTELLEIDAYYDYSMTVHGKGWKNKGLLNTAICTDCHTNHYELKADDERSTVHTKNIPATCGTCHKGIYDEYMKSDHAITKESKSEYRFPTCADCHSAHKISEIDQDEFIAEVSGQCGTCHKEMAETYLDTYHGKAYSLGYEKAARCSNCHTAHSIFSMSNPESSIHENNIVETCKACHEDANKKFTGYLTHATHYNKEKFPELYYTFMFMTSLLLGVFGFFGLHLLLWLPRSFKQRKKKHHVKQEGTMEYVRRFTRAQRLTHLFVIVSFIMLAFTGMVLKFANMEWAQYMSYLVGGVKAAGLLHRFGAIITFGYFIFHLITLTRIKIKQKISIWKFVFGKDSLMFNKQDIKDFIATIKWFVGKGPRPKYGRWTYWEKFDYMAVFWGVAVIGFSGLVLWLPEFFTKFFPGWLINVCQIIHSDEALLAVGFIFTIHFFNTHFRPEAFPMDTVVFTGHIPLEEFKEDRPREYQELVESGRINEITVKKEISKLRMNTIKTFGFIFLILGFTLVGFIIYSLIVG